jgi:hypothetical protein
MSNGHATSERCNEGTQRARVIENGEELIPQARKAVYNAAQRLTRAACAWRHASSETAAPERRRYIAQGLDAWPLLRRRRCARSAPARRGVVEGEINGTRCELRLAASR